MIIEYQDQREFKGDQHYFLHDKTQSVFKRRNIKNQCVDLFSSMIEVFGDEAVTQILKVIQDQLQETESIEESKDAVNEAGYTSQNENHVYKKMDVGMILFGLFIEDIQMYSIRHPEVSISKFIESISQLDFSSSINLSSYLRGRSLWCFTTCSETFIEASE